MKFEIEDEIDQILNQDYSAQEAIIYSGKDFDDGLDEQFYAEGDAAGGAPAATAAPAGGDAGAAQTQTQTQTKVDMKVDAGMGGMDDIGGMDDMGGMGGMGDDFGGGGGGAGSGFGAEPEEDVEPLPGEDSGDIEKKLVIFRQYRRLKEILNHLSDTIDESNKKIHTTEARNLLSRMDSEITTTLDQIDFIIAEDFRKKEVNDTEREYKAMEEKAKLIAKTIQQIVNHASRLGDNKNAR